MQEMSGIWAEKVDGGRMMDRLTDLSRWIKLSGSRDELDTFEYVQAKLKSMGFDTKILSHDAYISLPGAAKIEVDGQSMSCITHSHSRASAEDGTRGRLVYLGTGSEEAYRSQDVRGCIVLLEGMATPVQARRATDAGAVAQIHITPDHQLHEMCISPVWGSPSAETRDLLPNTVAVTISRDDGAKLRAALEQGQSPDIVIRAEVDTGWRKTPVLIAEMIPPHLPTNAPFVLFSGHIDTWYYGVMDNGAANVTMLEVAEICSHSAKNWQRGLRLGFWSGHSHGRYSGSTWYADEFFLELAERCIAHVNVDSTGGIGATVVTNSGSASELRGIATEAVALHAGQKYGGRRVGRQGDQSFWGVGIPGMFGSLSHQPAPSDGSAHMHLGWWWHSPEDTLDKIDEANLIRDTKVFAHVLSRLLLDPVAPLDYTAFATDLQAEIEKLRQELPSEFSVEPLVQATERLSAAIAKFMKQVEHAEPEAGAHFDATLIKLARLLVPIDYTSGNRFDHDAALPQQPYPTLFALRQLQQTPTDSTDWNFMAVSAKRAQNRFVSSLLEACKVLEK